MSKEKLSKKDKKKLLTSKLSQEVRSSENIKNIILAGIDDAKLLDVSIYKCKPDYMVDFIIIAQGTSKRHVEGAAERIVSSIKRDCKVIPIVDKNNKEWIVVDASSILLHIMVEDLRLYYKLDELMIEFNHELVN